MMRRYDLVSNDDSVRTVGEDFHMRNVAGASLRQGYTAHGGAQVTLVGEKPTHRAHEALLPNRTSRKPN